MFALIAGTIFIVLLIAYLEMCSDKQNFYIERLNVIFKQLEIHCNAKWRLEHSETYRKIINKKIKLSYNSVGYYVFVILFELAIYPEYKVYAQRCSLEKVYYLIKKHNQKFYIRF